jgi:hypothetical protein
MFRAWGSERSYQAIMDEIRSRPNFTPRGSKGKSFAEVSGLDLTDLFTKREENLVSKWADKIPGGRRSNRAYTAFLNRLRADVFDNLMKNNPEARTNPVLAEGLADFVNMASGRGKLNYKLGKYTINLERSGETLNRFIFSPKLIASRLQVLNPYYYVTAHPTVRMEALKSLAAITATGMTTIGLAKLAQAAGADVQVSADPTDSDFGKIQLGKVRIDPWGGHQQYIVAFSRMSRAFNRQVMQGKKPEFNNSMWDIADRFRRSKEHPSAGFAEDMMRGRDFRGKRVEYPQSIIDLYTPMIAEDIRKLAKEDPSLLPVVIPAEMFGMGVQVQDRR